MNQEQLKDSIARGVEWIVTHQSPDGRFPSTTEVVESCYKGLWCLQLCGRTVEAHRLANVVSSWTTPDGDIPQPREEQAFFTTHYLYAHGYLTIGAQVLGRFELARKLSEFILTRQSRGRGGFISQGLGHDENPCLDTVSTSISGLASLFTGRLDTAREAAAFLRHVFDSQPDPRAFFYTTTTLDGQLIRESPDGEGHRVIQVDDPEQDWYFIGIATVFLPFLYRATGERQYLELAERYLRYLDESCCEGAFKDFSSGKSGVGAAHLYRLTGDERYRRIAERVADFIMGHQSAAGCWREHPEDKEESPALISWSDMDMTAEYVLWLKLIECYLTD